MKISPSRLLLPLSYASIAGGTLTLVGTTTTLLVDGILRKAADSPAYAGMHLEGFAFFDILPMGVIFCVIALVYLVLVGPYLLPNRPGLVTAITPGTTRQYLTEMELSEDSRLVGRRLSEMPDLTSHMRFVQLVRGEETHLPPFHQEVLRPKDMLLIKAAPEEIVHLLQQPGVTGPRAQVGGSRITGVDVSLAEVIIPPGSRLEGNTVEAAHLRDRFGVVVLAVLRRSEHLREHLGAVVLRVGDTLLVQGGIADIERISGFEHDMIRLGGRPPKTANKSKAPLAIAIGALALGAGAAGFVPIVIAVLLASVFLVAGECLTSAQAYRSVNLRIIVVLGCMLSLGTAVKETGLARDIADGLIGLGGGSALGVLAMMYLATLLVTELVTNVATAGIMIPIALSTAKTLDVSYLPFVMAVTLTLLSPMATPSMS